MERDIKKSYSFFSTHKKKIRRKEGVKFFDIALIFEKFDFEILDVASSHVYVGKPSLNLRCTIEASIVLGEKKAQGR